MKMTALASLVLLLFALTAPASAFDASAHKADVEQKSRDVMPFSMDATKHIFTPTAGGGTQTVVIVKNDPKQVPLVRSHLQKEATAFARGDFGDPATIHGNAMPGLKTLEASKSRLSVRYRDIPNGGEIAFHSSDAAVVNALHMWFNAQVDDHGSHAMKM